MLRSPGRRDDEAIRRQIEQRLTESPAAEDHRDWFERLYVMAGDGEAEVPWDRGAPHRLVRLEAFRDPTPAVGARSWSEADLG